MVCPNKVLNHWPRQIKVHSPKMIKPICPTTESWSVKKKAAFIEAELNLAKMGRYPALVILNFESFYRPPLGPTRKKVGNRMRITDPGLLSKIPWDLFGIDEIHRIKKPGGIWSWAAYNIGKHAKRRVGLSGTMLPKDKRDAYAQFRFLDDAVFGTSYANFCQAYCVMGGYENRQVIGYLNEEVFAQKLSTITYSVDTDDVLDLPAVHDVPIYFDLSDSAKKVYRELEQEYIAQIDQGEIVAKNALVKMLRLCQMTGGFATTDDGNIHQIDNSKIENLLDKMQDLPPGEPVMVFYKFTPEAMVLRHALEAAGYKVGEISGRANDEQGWLDGKFNVMLLQIDACAEGLDTLTAARYGFFYTKGLISPGKLDQAIRRLKRPGQQRRVIFFHLIARGTVDQKIERSLKSGSDTIQGVYNQMKNRVDDDSDPFALAA
ncbi:MAG: DEAD/DEAH box helicase [Pseudomonadota bacterium]